MIGYLANEAIILWQVTYAAEKSPDRIFVPMISLLLPATLQPTFRTDPQIVRIVLETGGRVATDFSD